MIQEADTHASTISAADLKTVTQTAPSDEANRRFVIRVEMRQASSKATPLRLPKTASLIGAGAGQMNRVNSVELALKQAGENAQGAVLASDAFFPFDDGPAAAAKAGIKAIIQPGGSNRDADSIALCDRENIAMVFTGARHFKH